jgi:hypothetical protein
MGTDVIYIIISDAIQSLLLIALALMRGAGKIALGIYLMHSLKGF